MFSIDIVANLARMAYIGSDGYMYAGGNVPWTGGSSTNPTTFYKQESLGSGNIIDYDLGRDAGIALDNTGTVKVASGTSTTATWTTVSVGGTATGSGNRAIGVAINNEYQLVLMQSGAMYVATDGATEMTTIAITAATAASRDGIVDFAISTSYQYILFGNGELYYGASGGSSLSLAASNVLMFDYDGWSTHVYIYNESNQIRCSTGGSTSWTTLATVENVAQIRGAYYTSTENAGWGYLTEAGVLKTYESSATSTTVTRTVNNVDYFDCGSHAWAYLSGGNYYVWRSSGCSGSYITSYTTPTLITTATTSSAANATNPNFVVDDLGNPGIKYFPPANKPVFVIIFFILYINYDWGLLYY